MKALFLFFALLGFGNIHSLREPCVDNCQRSKPADPPTVTKAVPPIYPTIAAVAEASGTISVEVKIDRNGSVIDAKATDDHKLFKVAAERAAKLWTFNSTSDSDLVRTAKLTFIFKFVPKKEASPEELLPRFLPLWSIEVRATKPDYVYH